MIPVALVLALAAEVDVALVDETTCTTTVALFDAIDPKVPLEIPLHVHIELRADPNDDGLDARIELDTAGTSTTVRTLELVTGDCPLLPRLVASIAERYVTALPHRDWASFRRERKLSVVRPEPPPPPPPPVVVPVGATLFAEGGASAGLDANGFGATALATLAAGRATGPRIVAGVGVSSVFDVAVGDGRLDVVSVFAGLGPGYRIQLRAWSLMPSLRFVGGVHVGRGRGFDAASSQSLALFDVLPHLAVGRGPLTFAVMVPVSIARPRFVRASTGDAYDGPRARVALTVGWAWDLET